MVRAERVCAWCNASLGLSEGEFNPAYPITHGICAACGRAMARAGDVIKAQEFLDRLAVPVLVVDSSGRELAANRRAREALGKEFPAFDGFNGGVVIDCASSKAAEGCEGTVFCRSRVISRAVAETYASGQPCVAVPAYPDEQGGLEVRTPCLRITTEKAGGCVLLRVEEAGVAE
ncbi:MAG: hypothetical protein A2506_09280 [Elusimicrobia bacterium RIFOXYD12_FULL_66_9]|nr:MAG: hypothetical protein A2506_09280 [Elusimicrobia bacterium RIFOXYD12_FULL_66_9]